MERDDDLQLRDWPRLRDGLRDLLLVHAAAELHWDHPASVGQQTPGAGLGSLVHQHSKGKRTFLFRNVSSMFLRYFFMKKPSINCLLDIQMKRQFCSPNNLTISPWSYWNSDRNLFYIQFKNINEFLKILGLNS